MFHFRRSFITIITLFLFIVIVILFQSKELSSNDKVRVIHSHLVKKSLQTNNKDDEIHIPKRKIESEQIQPINLSHTESTGSFKYYIAKEKVNLKQKTNVGLLEDSELKKGEIIDMDKAAPDVIVKYDTGMFGLIDSDNSLHVWRAPFVTFGQIWPQPFSVNTGKDIYELCSRPENFVMKLTAMRNYILQEAIARYRELICISKSVSFYPPNWRHQESVLDKLSVGSLLITGRKQKSSKAKFGSSYTYPASLKAQLNTVNIYVESEGHQWPSLYMNETYHISVSMKGIFISAKETWGALRALESLSQLAWRTRSGRVFINESKVQDQPRFMHRGVMLDTARHFIPKNIILRNLDAMVMNKLNVFHWHITDDQSFPLVTDNHPEFALHGAYDPVNKIYTSDTVKEIIEYARVRGIRVIPEIDSPSHSLSWRKSHPEIMTRCIDMNGKWSGYYGPINMAAASTYRLLTSLYTDVINLFPDQWIHLGSDEVPTSCVTSNQAIQSWMRARGMFSVDSLVDFYTRQLQNIITKIGLSNNKNQRGFIVWQEAYERNSVLKKGTIVQLWKSQSTSEAAVLAKQNIKVVYSSCWYLDRLEYGSQWVNHYQCDPGDEYGNQMVMNDYGNVPVNENWRDNILGGEAAMWTEFMDADNVLPRIWPLASAAAERLWSPSFVNNAEKAASRLEEMRCRMLVRHIATGVASGAGDCGDVIEHSGDYSDGSIIQYPKSSNDLSSINSGRLIFQLMTNLLNLDILIVLLMLVAIFLCIYLRLHVHFSTRRLMMVVTATMTLYMLVWILSQNMLAI